MGGDGTTVEVELARRLNGAQRPALAAMPPRVTGEGVCAGTVRATSDGIGGAFAAWWSPREDGSAALLVSRRLPGGDSVWEAPVVADGRDRSRDGCNRAPPAIAANSARGYVHLAYYVDAPEGAGVYGGHSMEHGQYFHGPVAVVYGDRPVRTAIATSGELVAIAHEDPNSARPRIGLALSESAGHLFEHRLAASPPSVVAADPRVAISNRRIAVSWMSESWGGSAAATGSRLLRIGELTERVKKGTPGGGSGEADRRTHDR